MADPLADLSAHDVSIWLDDISRQRLRTGNLKGLVGSKHVGGGPSNPTSLQQAPGEGDAPGPPVKVPYAPAQPTHVMVDASSMGRDITLAIVSLKFLIGGPVFVVLGARRLVSS